MKNLFVWSIWNQYWCTCDTFPPWCPLPWCGDSTAICCGKRACCPFFTCKRQFHFLFFCGKQQFAIKRVSKHSRMIYPECQEKQQARCRRQRQKKRQPCLHSDKVTTVLLQAWSDQCAQCFWKVPLYLFLPFDSFWHVLKFRQRDYF